MSGRFEQKTHETLLKLLKVKSLDSISATDITSDLELTKQAFYYHAKNVPEYICGQIRKHVKEMTSDCGNNINKLLPAAEQGMHYFRANRIIMDGIMKSEKRDMYLNCLYDSIRKETESVLNRHLKKLPVDPEQGDAEMLAEFISGTLYELLKNDLESGMSKEPLYRIEQYKRYYGKAISVNVEKFMKKTL